MTRVLSWIALSVSPLVVVGALTAGVVSIDLARREALRPAAQAPAVTTGRGSAAALSDPAKASAAEATAGDAKRADAIVPPIKRVRPAPAAIERPSATAPGFQVRPGSASTARY